MPETVSVQQNDLVARIDCPVTTSRLNTGDTTCLKSHHWLCICRPIIFSLLLSEVMDMTPFIYHSGNCTDTLQKSRVRSMGLAPALT